MKDLTETIRNTTITDDLYRSTKGVGKTTPYREERTDPHITHAHKKMHIRGSVMWSIKYYSLCQLLLCLKTSRVHHKFSRLLSFSFLFFSLPFVVTQCPSPFFSFLSLLLHTRFYPLLFALVVFCHSTFTFIRDVFPSSSNCYCCLFFLLFRNFVLMKLFFS